MSDRVSASARRVSVIGYSRRVSECPRPKGTRGHSVTRSTLAGGKPPVN